MPTENHCVVLKMPWEHEEAELDTMRRKYFTIEDLYCWE